MNTINQLQTQWALYPQDVKLKCYAEELLVRTSLIDYTLFIASENNMEVDHLQETYKTTLDLLNQQLQDVYSLVAGLNELINKP